MTLFWASAALLVALCMAVLLRPLLRATLPARDAQAVPAREIYREQMQELHGDLRRGILDAALHRKAQDELGRRLLDDSVHAPGGARPDRGARAPRLAALLLAAVPSAAILLYLQLGNPMALWRAGDGSDMAAKGNTGHEMSNAQVEALVNQLAQRLRKEPADAEGWYMLGRSYAAMERPADAALAYARAVELVPDEAMLRADYADVLASIDGGSLQGAAKAQIERALALDPDQPKALALAASAAMERGDKAQAVVYWEHLYRLLPPQSQTAARIAASLAQVRGEAARPAAPAQGAAGSVSGRVELAATAPRKAGPGETLFIYARPLDGSRMPLAVLRREARELPLAFTLDDSLAMRPDHRLSGQQQVMLEARISASGNALPQPGDLVGSAGPVALGSAGTTIVIAAQVPQKPGK